VSGYLHLWRSKADEHARARDERRGDGDEKITPSQSLQEGETTPHLTILFWIIVLICIENI